MNNTSTKGFILLAEDDTIQQMIVKKYAENLGYKVVVSNNGQEALDELKLRQFDFVLMDIQMPIMSGYQAIKLIRDKNTELPVIALTTLSEQDEREHIMSFGFTHFLSKPVNQKALENTLLKLNESKMRIKGKTLYDLNDEFETLKEQVLIDAIDFICRKCDYLDVTDMLQKAKSAYSKGQLDLSRNYIQEALYMEEDHSVT